MEVDGDADGGVDTDVNEVALASPALRQFLELIPDAIVAIDRPGRIVLANALAEDLFGYGPDQLQGIMVEDLIPDRYSHVHQTHRDGYFDDPKSRPMGIGLELAGKRRDGSEFPADISLTGFDTDAGPIASAAVRDISDRLEADQEKRELEEQAREARLQQARRMESIGELAGGIAHDFNNLLAVILNNTELALDDKRLSKETNEELQEILGVAERGAKLTRQLLIFSRKQQTPHEPTDLNELIDGLEQLLRRTLGEHIELTVKLGDELPAVMSDPSQLEQVLINLAINARDAMPSGGSLRIETKVVELDDDYVRSRPEVEAGPHVQLAVMDSGTGMSPEVVARAFEPFFTTKPKGEGTGLGLATVYGIVKQSGGHVGIYTEEGSGTVIRVHLPVHTGGAASPGAVDEQPIATRAEGEVVLVVEDSEEVRRTLRRVLEPNGYEVLCCSRPSEALEFVERSEQPIDVVLTDVVMPEMLGTELAKHIRALRPDVPILYMSGYAEGGAPTDEDMPAMIEKPFSRADLLQRLQEALGKAHGPMSSDADV